MKKYNIILIIGLIFFSTFLAFTTPSIATPENINYTFENRSTYNSTTPLYEDSFNIRNQSIYTEHYNATYSFENQNIGDEGINIEFLNESVGEYIIIENLDGHDKIMMSHDNGTNPSAYSDEFTPQITGVVEFWWMVEDATDTSFFYLYNELGRGVQIVITSESFFYRNATATAPTGVTALDDTWYHISLDFDCTTDTYDFYINGILAGNDLHFREDGDGIIKLRFLCNDDIDQWFDAFGYSWNSFYNINDNIIPYQIINDTIKEVDKWEFSYSDFPTQYTVGSDIFSDWTEDDTGDHINIAMDYDTGYNPTYYPDRKIKIHDHIGSGANIGIERDFNILNGILNISWSYNFTALDPIAQSETTTEIYSSDDTLLFQIYLEMGDICYKDGGEQQLEVGIIDTGEIYDFNFYINPYDNINILRFSIDETFYDSYLIPSLDPNKKGLGEIKFKNYYDPPRELIVYLDNIGIYSNGTSLSTEVAFRQINLNETYYHAKPWWFTEESLLALTLEGNLGIHLTDWYFYTGLHEIEEIISLRQFNGIEKTFNVYDQTHDGEQWIYVPKFWIEFYGQFKYTQIRIDGVIITDGIHLDYHLEFDSNNIDFGESYFYVKSNELHYTITFDDENLEYIQAEFTVPQSTKDYILSFNHYNSHADSYSFSQFKFIDNTLLTFITTTSGARMGYKFLTANTIDKMTFYISDGNNYSNTTMTGYVKNIDLTYAKNPIGIVSTTFIAIIPILFILIPLPFFMWSKYDKNPIVLIGTFFIMALICTITSLIPIWLMFVFILGMVGIFIKEGE